MTRIDPDAPAIAPLLDEAPEETKGTGHEPVRLEAPDAGYQEHVRGRVLALDGRVDERARAEASGLAAKEGATTAKYRLEVGPVPAVEEPVLEKRPLVVVAGATGNAGRAIVQSLAAQGCRVRALVRNADRLREAKDSASEIRVLDVTDPAAIAGVMDGADFFVSALGKTYQTDGAARRDIDVDANLELFAEAKRAGIKKVGLISVIGADPDSPGEILRMKAETEAGLEKLGLPHVILRPTGFFTDMWEMYRQTSGGTFWWLSNTDIHLNPIHPRDIGDCMAEHLLDAEAIDRSETLEIGGPETFDKEGLERVCEEVRGKELRTRNVPRWVLRAAAFVLRFVNRNWWEAAQTALEGSKLENFVGEPVGSRRLANYLRARAAQEAA